MQSSYRSMRPFPRVVRVVWTRATHRKAIVGGGGGHLNFRLLSLEIRSPKLEIDFIVERLVAASYPVCFSSCVLYHSPLKKHRYLNVKRSSSGPITGQSCWAL